MRPAPPPRRCGGPWWRWALLAAALVALALTFLSTLAAGALWAIEAGRALAALRALPAGVAAGFWADAAAFNRTLAALPARDGGEGLSRRPTRGIVVPAGGADQLANAFANVWALRRALNCSLPVTVAYWGGPGGDAVPPAVLALFDEHFGRGVRFLDLAAAPWPPHQRRAFPPDAPFVGFLAKVYAVYAAPYDHVLAMDADAMAAADPAPLFDDPGFVRAGSLFWPDRWCRRVPLDAAARVPRAACAGRRRAPARDVPQTDSGVFLVDRRRHAAPLEWALFLNTRAEYVYRLAHGDKDTWRAAFALAGAPAGFRAVRQPLSLALAGRGGLLAGGFAPRGFVQHAPRGGVAFVHRTSLAKYALGGGGGGARSFERLLLQPHCRWSEARWHFFSPDATALLGAGARAARAGRRGCNFTMEAPADALRDRRCGVRYDPAANPLATPPLLEVPPGSALAAAQAAADAAFELYRRAVAGAAAPPPAAGAHASAWRWAGAAAGVAAAGAAAAAAWRRRRRRQGQPRSPDKRHT